MRVSVIVTNFNRSDLLMQIASVLGKCTVQLHEWVIIDDASEIDPMPFVRKASELLNCSVRMVRHSQNMGAAASRNRGISEASGEALVFIDSDVTFSQDTFERLVEALDDADIAFPKVLYEDGSLMSPTDAFTTRYCLDSMMFAVRKAALSKMDEWFDELMGIYQEDVDFFLRANAVGLKFAYQSDAVVKHPLRNSISATHLFYGLRNSLWMSSKLIGLVPYKRPYIIFAVSQSILWLVNSLTRRHWAAWPRRVTIMSSRQTLLMAYCKSLYSYMRNLPQLGKKRKRLRIFIENACARKDVL